MKRAVRTSTFETNSSSVHAMVMCSEEDFERIISGELGIDARDGRAQELGAEDSLSYHEFMEGVDEYQTFEDHFDGVVAFGYYI